MKTSILALLAVIGTAAANRPQLSLNIKGGNFENIGGLEPSLSWSGSCSTPCDIGLKYGIEASAVPTTDLASIPKNIWGKVSTSVGDWGLSARAKFSGIDFNNADVDIDAVSDENDLSLHIEASAGSGFNINKVEVTKGFEVDGYRVTVNPRYNIDADEADVLIAYNKDKTDIEVTASQNEQSVTLTHRLNADNRIAPTFASNGNISLEWEHKISDDNSVTTTLKPNESVDVVWKDSSWTANINLPMDGTDIKGTNISVKREVIF